jgi:hypothetical protein
MSTVNDSRVQRRKEELGRERKSSKEYGRICKYCKRHYVWNCGCPPDDKTVGK